MRTAVAYLMVGCGAMIGTGSTHSPKGKSLEGISRDSGNSKYIVCAEGKAEGNTERWS